VAGIVLGTFFGTILLMYFINSIREVHENRYLVEERRSVRRKNGSSRSGRREVREVRRPSRVYTSSS
jgi:hypothetical protein